MAAALSKTALRICAGVCRHNSADLTDLVITFSISEVFVTGICPTTAPSNGEVISSSCISTHLR